MDSDLIAMEAMIATRESALWMFWSMIGTGVTALATLVAASFAWKALSVWQHQEKRSERKALKVALVNYRNVLIKIPSRLVPGPAHAVHAFELCDAMNKIYESIEILEININNDVIGKNTLSLTINRVNT